MADLKIPFSFFDFFGYLFPGFIFATAIIWLLIPNDPVTKIIDFFNSIKDFKYIFSFVIFIVIYGFGHVVSSFASYLFEGILIAKWLGYPSDNLFKNKSKNTWLFSSYGQNYSEQFRVAFNKTFTENFGEFGNYDKFMICFNLVKEKCPATTGRLAVFISLYDFSRNSAMALIPLALVSIFQGYYLYGVIIFGMACLFISRYLKFFRIYGDEVFRSFYVYFKTK